jgi:hypothetical protein
MKYWGEYFGPIREKFAMSFISLAIVFLLRQRLLNSCTFPRQMISAALVKHCLVSSHSVIVPEYI